MDKVIRRGPGRGISTGMGLLSFAMAVVGFHGWYASNQLPNPAHVRHLAGHVRQVKYRNDRYGQLARIHFFLDDDPSDLEYPDFYPAFRDAARCIHPGAAIDGELDRDAGNLVALRCDGTLIAGAADLAAARRENGRAGMDLGIAFLVSTALCVWWFFTSPPPRRPGKPKRRQNRRRATSSGRA